MAEEKTVQMSDTISVGEFSELIEKSAAEVVKSLMMNGVMATVSDAIDYETAAIIGEELGVTVEQIEKVSEVVERKNRKMSTTAIERPPVIAVMGHVDHGKTTLLDAIRKANTTDDEAGGITQHISAYQVTHNDRVVTFLDTPGHEAFASLREHGAALTDVALIVVAADDGIKPQTLEAIKYAQNAGVKIVIAINKVDKPTADLNRVKQELSDHELQPEEWGGKTVTVEVSAKDGTNIEGLLDMLLLVTDIEELKAETDVEAEGIIIESHISKGKGPLATALVEHGELKVGDILVAGDTYGKVRSLQSTIGGDIVAAGPSTPVVISGFKGVPTFGTVFHRVGTDKEAKKRAQENSSNTSAVLAKSIDKSSSDSMLAQMSNEVQEVNVVVKADVRGSLTSLTQSLEALGNADVKVTVVASGVGQLSESDIMIAKTSNAMIVGFNVSVSSALRRMALNEKVDLKMYTVIYELLDDMKEKLTERLAPEIIEEDIGRLKIKGIFRTTRNLIICGGEVTKGKAKPNIFARISRDEKALGEVQVAGVKKEQIDVKEAKKGDMCGLELKTEQKINLKIDDTVDFFTRETRARTLD